MEKHREASGECQPRVMNRERPQETMPIVVPKDRLDRVLGRGVKTDRLHLTKLNHYVHVNDVSKLYAHIQAQACPKPSLGLW